MLSFAAWSAAEGGHAGAAGEPSGFLGVLAQGAWLIPVVPLLAMGLIVLFGKRLPLKGWELAEGALVFVGLYGAALLIGNWVDPFAFERHVEIARIGVLPGGHDLVLEWGWVVDGLSTMMYFVVGVVGSFVFTYAKGYMKGDVRFTWFFAAFSLFAGGMLVLVSSPNTIQLIVGWELVGVASYLLIGHWWEDHANNAAAIKAFLVNKVADVGLFIGVIISGLVVGSFRFTDLLDAVEAGDSALADVGVWVGLALFIGAMGKSAQWPFHVWLPDAMAGPTPVSSLMHAATMVTAGVYLLGRMFPFYQAEGFGAGLKPLILVIGALTLFLGGLLALVQDDIKKVLAYSTVSQLGYMTAAMGAGAYTAGLFHLFTHAFFKGLLFLAAGSVIHAVHSNNMSDMGGLRKAMPKTYWTFLIGSLALAGIVPLAGFWSKDEILASLAYDGQHGGGRPGHLRAGAGHCRGLRHRLLHGPHGEPHLLREVQGPGSSPRVAAGDDLPAHRPGGARRGGRAGEHAGVVHRLHFLAGGPGPPHPGAPRLRPELGAGGPRHAGGPGRHRRRHRPVRAGPGHPEGAGPLPHPGALPAAGAQVLPGRPVRLRPGAAHPGAAGPGGELVEQRDHRRRGQCLRGGGPPPGLTGVRRVRPAGHRPGHQRRRRRRRRGGRGAAPGADGQGAAVRRRPVPGSSGVWLSVS